MVGQLVKCIEPLPGQKRLRKRNSRLRSILYLDREVLNIKRRERYGSNEFSVTMGHPLPTLV